MDLLKELPNLLPLAIKWAEETSEAARRTGAPLGQNEMAIARRVGVQSPELIRLLIVDNIPMPEDAILRNAAQQAGLLSPNFIGLTLGYAIFFRGSTLTPRLFAHECRHVAQYEFFGSIAAFLNNHLADVVRVGYQDSILERDARAYENCVP
jgi:hypothetical protein